MPKLSTEDQSILAAIDFLRGDLRHSLAHYRRWQCALARQTRALSVRGSNSIDGIHVDKDTALEIVSQNEVAGPVTSAWLAVKRYSDAMTYCRELASDSCVTVDETLIRALHFMVQGHDLAPRSGRYWRGDVPVTEDDSLATVYTGPPSQEVATLMGEHVARLMDAQFRGMPSVIQGAMAHLNLVMIHPFADGNGRISRIMQSLMLYRDGVDEADFVSIEEYCRCRVNTEPVLPIEK